jgi:hypothetical protein
VNLHKKLIQYCSNKWIAREPQSASKKVEKHDNLVSFGSWSLLIEGSATVASREKYGSLIVSDQVRGDFRFTKDEGWKI